MIAWDTALEPPAEEVCLVDEYDRDIGVASKAKVHGRRTPLHRAFSIFLFNETGQLLLQQRALHKKTWPGIWSNSCCGHPLPGESLADAAKRRLYQELHLTAGDLFLALPHFRYRARYQGIEENEICPVLVGRVHADMPAGNADEVANLAWVDWEVWQQIAASPNAEKIAFVDQPGSSLSPWSIWETRLLSRQEPDWRKAIDALPLFIVKNHANPRPLYQEAGSD